MSMHVNNVKTPIFSAAEIKVAELLVRGYSEKEIADKPNISPHTVNNHMRHIRENNGLTKNTEVITAYIAFVRRKKFSIEALRELGLSAIMVVINICQYTETNL